MTKVNKKFVEEMQKRLNEKDKIYVRELSYKNMTFGCLWGRLIEHYMGVGVIMESSLVVQKQFKKAIKIDMVDIANFCWMLWERLGEDNEK